MDPLWLAFVGLAFVAAFLAVEGALLWWHARRGPEALRLARRIRQMSAGDLADEDEGRYLKKRVLAEAGGLERMLLSVPRLARLDRLIVQAGADWTVSNLLAMSGLGAAVGLLGGLVLRAPWPIAIGLALVLAALPFQVLLHRRRKRLARFEALLPEAMDLIARALRAGHSLPSALQVAGDELPDPIGPEFRQTFDEINFGVTVHAALLALAHRVPSTDLRFFVVAVQIQRETGGNLTEVLGNIGGVIRDRIKLMGQVRTLTAEGRLSGWVLSLLPFATALVLWLINGKLMSVLWTDPHGLRMLVGGLVAMVVGILWMRTIVRIRV